MIEAKARRVRKAYVGMRLALATDIITIVEPTDELAILRQPGNIAAVAGDTVTFSVDASGVAKYQWQVTSTGGASWNNLSWDGATTATMTHALNLTNIAYQYRCLLTGEDGSTLATDIINIVEPTNALVILRQPGVIAAAAGDTATFKVDVQGAVTYQWQYSADGGESWNNLSWEGATTAAMTHALNADNIKYKYRCVLTEGNCLTRKIGKSYDVVGGVARQFYSAEFMRYTGNFEEIPVVYNGKNCMVYRLTSSGVLTLFDDALVWLCGGGAAGYSGEGIGGGGGGGGYVNSGSLEVGEHVISVAGAGGVSKVGTTLTAEPGKTPTVEVNGGDGGSGGGACGGSIWGDDPQAGKGAGKSTYPFGITSLNAHCAGGGAGVYQKVYARDNTTYYYGGAGGNGGSNGGAGAVGACTDTSDGSSITNKSWLKAGTGGSYGGGDGGGASLRGRASSASFYGGGGGGKGWGKSYFGDDGFTGSGGSGYQGVVYILDVNGGTPV